MESKHNFISSPAFGIDLGTSQIRGAVWIDNELSLVPHEDDDKSPYSTLTFTDSEIYCGHLAKTQFSKNAINTIYNAKRLIGRKFHDKSVQKDIKLMSLKVEAGLKDRPLIVVTHKGETRKFLPEQISALIISKMKTKAEKFLQKPIEDVIISVPAYFSHTQRKATKDAGTIAGLNVIRLVKEPIARLLAWEGFKDDDELRRVAIIDIGSGKFDACVVFLDWKMFETRAISGNSSLGGDDFDTKILELCIEDFKAKTGVDIKNNARAIRRLRNMCERAKITLSTSTQASIEIDELAEGHDFTYVITRSKFEEVCQPFFDEILEALPKLFQGSYVDRDDIDQVILTGGTTNIPKIQSIISEYFKYKKIERRSNDFESVAVGTAMYCAVLKGQKKEKFGDLPLIIDANPIPFGIETVGGTMTPIVKKHSPIPCKNNQIFTTANDNQPQVTIQVYEGESEVTKNNNLLEKFILSGIPPALKGVPQIEVTFSIDANGILDVKANHKDSGAVCEVLVENKIYAFSDEEIVKMKKENKELLDYFYPSILDDVIEKVKGDRED